MRLNLLYCLLFIHILFFQSFAQTGKISGSVTDAETGDPLIGANVLVIGTTMGAATDVDGYYSVINVPPGVYSLRVSNIGYTTQTIVNLAVNINQTTFIDVQLSEETIETEEVIVVAPRPIIQKDVSSSTININVNDVENLPVASIVNVVALQPGVQVGSEGFIVRGRNFTSSRGSSSAENQTAFVLNGITLRDERDNTPYTGISLTSIEEVQVQTGGFNAEYGNVRSGLVNVVTKEGKRDKYTFSFFGRYRPAGLKYFGDPPNSLNSYWIRPYVDPAVAWTGTTGGGWDEYTQKQYQEFRGWNRVSEELLSDSDPTNDLTPEAAQRLFLWQHRKDFSIRKPDYDVDLNFTGPIPGGELLGDLRFAFSYKRTQEMYMIPLSDDAYRDYNYQLKLTSDIKDGMKLSLEGLIGQQSGTNSSRTGGPGLFRSPGSISNDLDFRSGASYLDSRVFATDYWNPSYVDVNMQGAKLTHVINPETFYEITLSRISFEYHTFLGDLRDTTRRYEFGGVFFDEAPFNFFSGTGGGIGSSMNLGLGFSNSRDSSKLTTYTAKFDIASQVDKYNYVKAGVEFILTDNNVNYAFIEPALPSNNSFSKWHTYPIRAALYAQDKLEFEGMIANLGLRLDYSNPGGEWYDLEQFDDALTGELPDSLKTLEVESQFYLSPRLGIAFPISVDSKLFFNYGHFRQMPVPEDLFLVRNNITTDRVTRIADPNNPLPRTVAYELGYEHNLFDQLLLRVAGYYKDVTEQPELVNYRSRNNAVDYVVPEPNLYEDIRGFEISVYKNRGDWVRGFINYTYMVSTGGFFGLPSYSENPAVQRETERNTALFGQIKPVPQPYGRANIDFFTPLGFGPEIGGIHIFEDIVVNLLGTWSSGTYFSWTGTGAAIAGFENNIQWADFYNLNMRVSKGFYFSPVRLEFFMDVTNVLNTKYMSYRAGFADLDDWNDYMKSLHLPEEYRQFATDYEFIAGDDKPGDVRSEDKPYIDMPNLNYTALLNPRDIFWGIRFSLEIQ